MKSNKFVRTGELDRGAQEVAVGGEMKADDEPVPGKSDSLREGVARTLAEFKSLAACSGGVVRAEHVRLDLDESDLEDANLVNLFREAGLSPDRPEHWRLLLETFAHYYYAKKGRPPKLSEADKIDLIRDAYRVARQAESLGHQVSLSSICDNLIDGPKSYRVPAQYRDPQGPLHPKTLQNRLDSALTFWEQNKDLPDTWRNYEFVPHVHEEISLMVGYLISLRR